MRIALGIEYDGQGFSGWQRQVGTNTVQDSVERALSKVADSSIALTCAGRTDAGVHAMEQVVHFDTHADRTARSWVLGTNTHLPNGISIQWATKTEDTFHARFSAQTRQYRYVIYNHWVRPAILSRKVTWIHAPLDITRMREASSHLVGRHDFSSYRALACQAKSPIRTVYDINLTQEHYMIYIDIRADAFLHHMVRNIAGVLVAIGKGEHSCDWSREILEYRDRTKGGVTAPADGLYLVYIDYPDNFKLPQLIRTPRF